MKNDKFDDFNTAEITTIIISGIFIAGFFLFLGTFWGIFLTFMTAVVIAHVSRGGEFVFGCIIMWFSIWAFCAWGWFWGFVCSGTLWTTLGAFYMVQNERE